MIMRGNNEERTSTFLSNLTTAERVEMLRRLRAQADIECEEVGGDEFAAALLLTIADRLITAPAESLSTILVHATADLMQRMRPWA